MKIGNDLVDGCSRGQATSEASGLAAAVDGLMPERFIYRRRRTSRPESRVGSILHTRLVPVMGPLTRREGSAARAMSTDRNPAREQRTTTAGPEAAPSLASLGMGS